MALEHGVSINPIAFLVVTGENVRVIPVNYTSAVDKLIEYVPDLMDKANCILNKAKEKKCKNSCKSEEENTNINSDKTVEKKRVKNKVEDIEVEYDDTTDDENYIEDDE